MDQSTVTERQQAVDAARALFDRWARFYGADPVSVLIRRAQTKALSTLALGGSDRLLDVGCGPGEAVRRAATHVDRATGLDLSPAMLARARSKAREIANVDFVEGDSAHLPFPDGAFTAVLSTTSFHHYVDPVGVLAEMRRVLAASGRLAISDLSSDRLVMRAMDAVLRRYEQGHVRFQSTGGLTALVRDAGFDDVTARPLLGGTYVLVTAVAPAS
jgi:ubiquinone/menaquinone biosynthesis C-methylase UbiE